MLAVILSTSGCRSVGIVSSRSKAKEFSYFFMKSVIGRNISSNILPTVTVINVLIFSPLAFPVTLLWTFSTSANKSNVLRISPFSYISYLASVCTTETPSQLASSPLAVWRVIYKLIFLPTHKSLDRDRENFVLL
jgi:hypothetical protein